MSSSSRLHEKLEKCKQEKDFYQAHQICKTIYVRLRSSSNDEQILKFLFESACYFLEHDQSNSGYDLCKCFIETLNRATTISELTGELREQICTLFRLLKCFHDERAEFTYNVLRWSTSIPFSEQNSEGQLPVRRLESNSSFSTSILTTLTEPSASEKSTGQRPTFHKSGHPQLHESFAHILWEQEKNYHDSRYHYLRSHDGRAFAAMLIEAHQTLGFPSEIDLFIAQTVLQYLLLRNFHTAYLVFVTYVEQHPKIRQSPPGPFNQLYPLLNFLWFLLLCLKKLLVKPAGGEPNHRSDPLLAVESTRCFSSLVEAYKPSLERDSTLLQYVERLGALFFGLKQKSAASSNPLENLMQSLTAQMGHGSRGHHEQHQLADLDLDVD